MSFTSGIACGGRCWFEVSENAGEVELRCKSLDRPVSGA